VLTKVKVKFFISEVTRYFRSTYPPVSGPERRSHLHVHGEQPGQVTKVPRTSLKRRLNYVTTLFKLYELLRLRVNTWEDYTIYLRKMG
jgi:hypothetical protein